MKKIESFVYTGAYPKHTKVEWWGFPDNFVVFEKLGFDRKNRLLKVDLYYEDDYIEYLEM